MKRIVCCLLAVCFAGCSVLNPPVNFTEVKLNPVPNTCYVAHLSADWYSSEDLTVCYDQHGVESEYSENYNNAFTILMGILGATAGAGAILLAK